MSEIISKFAPKTNKHTPNMKQFSCTNFRKFENKASIDLKGINVLVGPNNAGKSTFVKAMLVMCDILQNAKGWNSKVNFDTPMMRQLNINGWKDICNYNAPRNGRVSLSCTFENLFFTLNLRGIGRWVRIDSYEVADIDGSWKILIGENSEATFRVKDLSLEGISCLCEEWNLFSLKDDGLNVLYELCHKIENSISEKWLGPNLNTVDAQLLSCISYIDSRLEIYRKQSEDSDYNISVSDALIHRNMRRIMEDLKVLQSVVSAMQEKSEFVTIHLNDNHIGNRFHTIEEVLDGETVVDSFVVSLIRDLIGNMPVFKTIICQTKQGGTIVAFLPEVIKDTVNKMVTSYSTMTTVPPHDLFLYREQDDIVRLLGEYQKVKRRPSAIRYNKIVNEWILGWMKQFGVCDDFEIKDIEGEAVTIKLLDGKRHVSLGDKGRGPAHMFVLLLKVATLCTQILIDSRIMRRKVVEETLAGYADHIKPSNHYLFFVEEPEANLHPDFQSKLSELFLDVHEKFGIQFFVETHSEYLVRHIQVLAVDRTLVKKEHPFSVTYFRSQKDSSDVYCYNMGLQADGSFEKMFEGSFYGQSSEDAIQLSRLSRNYKMLHRDDE